MRKYKESSLKGFYLIPNYSKYLISKEGKVYSTVLKRELLGGINNRGYHNLRIKDDSGRTVTWGMHRLLAYTFKHPESPIDGLIVNHLDGNKLNNELDNLEWCTYSENQEHAGKFGLTEKCKEVLVKNIVDNKILIYPSYLKCANDLGITKDAVSYRMRYGRGRVYDGKYIFMKVTEGETLSPKNSGGYKSLTKPVLVKSIWSSEHFRFVSVSSLSDYLGIGSVTLLRWLRLEVQPIVPGFKQICLEEDFNGNWTEHDKPFEFIERITNSKFVTVTDHELGVETMVFKLKEAAKLLNSRVNTLHSHLKRKSKYKGRYSLRYTTT